MASSRLLVEKRSGNRKGQECGRTQSGKRFGWAVGTDNVPSFTANIPPTRQGGPSVNPSVRVVGLPFAGRIISAVRDLDSDY